VIVSLAKTELSASTDTFVAPIKLAVRIVKPPKSFAQRKVYGVIRIGLAIIRLNKATTEIERDKAGQWVWAWVSLTGTRHVKPKRNTK
jgi:hypothetical protein